MHSMQSLAIGYHASHEQFPPSALLRAVKLAEQAGFTAMMCSDHFHPWGEAQGHSGFAWSWLGAALATTQLPAGVVNAPVGRYHPAIIAQAAATLSEMFAQRFWIAVGSGEALNERIVDDPWPEKPARNARLREAVDVMRALWAGQTVTHRGAFVVREAKLYTRPVQPPAVYAAALSVDTARWAGEWADGLVTISAERDTLRGLIDAFREGGGEGKPLILQVKLSYAATDDQALAGAYEQWRTNAVSSPLVADCHTPAHFDAIAQFVRPEDMHAHVRISADLGRQRAWLEEDLAMGFDHLMLHNVNTEQQRFIEQFGQHVLPPLLYAAAR